MSIRNLDALFDPDSIAVFGASLQVGRIGTTVWRNLSCGHYQGKLYAVNPKYHVLGTHPVVARASDLPTVPALAVICTPPSTVAALIKELAALGTRAAVVMTPGMEPAQKQAMLKAARAHLLRILGPNCLGFLAPHKNLNASYSPIDALPGELAFVSQSGVLVTAMLDWAHARGIGFSHFVALGEHADVDLGDVLDYLASDAKTRAILLYVESIESARKFMSAARAAARNKPVLVVKAGRSVQRQVASTTDGRPLVCSDMILDAAIARAGMLRVDSLQELFVAAQTLSRFRSNRDQTLTIFANGHGAGLMAADAALDAKVDLSPLSDATLKQLDAVMPPHGPLGNPIDIGMDAPVTRYQQVLNILRDDAATGAMLFIHAPTAMLHSTDIARALLPLAQPLQGQAPRLMSCWLGDQAVEQARQIFQDADIASFETPEQAVRAFSMLTTYRRHQAELTEAPPALLSDRRPDTTRIQALVRDVLNSGRVTLTRQEVCALLDACHIQIQETVSRDHAQQLIVGSTIDKVFGPVILFGQGGAAGALVNDLSVALPPLNVPLAKALVSRTRVARLLEGKGGTVAVDQAALHGVLLAVSQLLAEIPEIAELEINPLIVNFEGAIALDARIRLSASAPSGSNKFAILPYPIEWEETFLWHERTLTLRPIRPEDEALHMAFLQQLDAQDVRMRLFYGRRTMERSELARLVQIDYAREMAFVALATDSTGQLQTLGVVRAMVDPDNIEAEFGVIVASKLKGEGLGLLLMKKMIAYLRQQGTQRLVATVLDYNERMLRLARELGFEEDIQGKEDAGTKKISLSLT